METIKSKFCPAMWLSGFFGLGAIVHLVRSAFGFSLVIAGNEISIGTSLIFGVVLGALSIALLVVSIKKPCESGHGQKKEKGACCGL